jgi:hypothetical protein
MASVEDFRSQFPSFVNTDTYPDARVVFWLRLGQKMLNKRRWGNVYEEGLYLFVAHNLTVEREVMSGTGAGGSDGGGGESIGMVTSESQTIGDTSYSATYSTGEAYSSDGQMSGTIYGQMYLDLVRIIGAGGVQL